MLIPRGGADLTIRAMKLAARTAASAIALVIAVMVAIALVAAVMALIKTVTARIVARIEALMTRMNDEAKLEPAPPQTVMARRGKQAAQLQVGHHAVRPGERLHCAITD